MDRRTFTKLAGFSALAALTENVEMTAEQAATVAGEVVLQDKDLLAAFDPVSGALTRMKYKRTKWDIQRRPALGASFRIFAPLPTQRANFIFGHKQRAESVKRNSDDQLQIHWSDLLSEHGGVLPIKFTATVTLKDGALTFGGILDNQSSVPVETIDYPYFGDLNPPTPDTPMRAEYLWAGELKSEEIYPHFFNGIPYWGVRYPTKTYNTNRSQFCLIQSPEQGIYTAMHDPAIRYLLQFTFEQQPGVIDCNENLVPGGDEISGIPAHLEFRTCHFVFTIAQSSTQLAPVVMRPYIGDWHAGLDVYREWRATWFGPRNIPDWVKDVHSWFQLSVNGAEQDYAVPYRNLVQYGMECAENDVRAIQLVGWSRGGQDGGDPCLSTDSGLGTWQELHEAIEQIQANGVKIILFGKPHFAAMSTEWYKEVLYKYAATDPYGIKYVNPGDNYTTPTQLAGINTRNRAVMDVCSQGYRDIATHEFEKILAFGAAGWLFDDLLSHDALYNFSVDHGYTPPGYLYSGDIPLAKQFRAAADRVNPDFVFSGGGQGDWLMPYYVLAYYRVGWGWRHAMRYIDPQAPLVVAIRGLDARDEINLALLYRYIIEYEPYNFKGHVTDFPLTLEYGKKVDALRRKYKAWIWDAEFHDNLGATVTADGSVRHTVYRKADGKRAVLIASLEQEKAIVAKLDLSGAGSLVCATPEESEARPASGSFHIPARSVVAVLEI